MSHNESVPCYEDWVRFCYLHGSSDLAGEGNPDEVDARRKMIDKLNVITIAEYLCRLFDNSERLIGEYSADQIAAGTRFIFGCESCYMSPSAVFDAAVPIELQSSVCIKVRRMYVHCFDVLCGRRQTTSECLANVDAIDGAVYMLWDMGMTDWLLSEPDNYPHIAGAAFGTLHYVLRECRTPACLLSALHGLGHAILIHPTPGQAIVQEFIERRGGMQPKWIREYAALALDGMVQ